MRLEPLGQSTVQRINARVWGVCDILRRSNCASATQYVPELTWILFLRILDARERLSQTLEPPYRWRDWAVPPNGNGNLIAFVNGKLLPYLKSLKNRPNATQKQKLISEIMSGVDRVRVDTESTFVEVLGKIHDIPDEIDAQHYFILSQIYEGLLLKMGEKAGDGGQFFTPREVIRAVVRVVDPAVGETVYDPCCGTGGFLAESFNHIRRTLGSNVSPGQLEMLRTCTFFGREKENLIYPVALANLVLHEIDRPNLWHGNTLSGQVFYDGLYQDAPDQFQVIVTNPPFGGKEGDDVQPRFSYKTSATQVLFLQHVIDHLADGGRCGIVLDEGVLFRTSEKAFVQTKRKLLDTCDLWALVSLPPGVFTAAGAAVKTNLLFFTKGNPTKRVWYYDVSDIKTGRTRPLLLSHLDDFFQRLPKRHTEAGVSERSWWVDRKTIEERNFDLKAVNPNRKTRTDARTPAELLDKIQENGRVIDDAVAELRKLLG